MHCSKCGHYEGDAQCNRQCCDKEDATPTGQHYWPNSYAELEKKLKHYKGRLFIALIQNDRYEREMKLQKEQYEIEIQRLKSKAARLTVAVVFPK